METKYVYLDQSAWIVLSKAYYKRDGTNIENTKQLNNLIKLINEGSIITPISLSHIKETSSISQKEKRERLASFMAEISEGNTIGTATIYLDAEIRNSIMKNILGIQTIDLRNYIRGKGVAHIFGSKIKIPETMPDAEKKKVKEIEEGKECLKFVLQDKEFGSMVPEDEMKQLISDMEKNRLKYHQFKDSKYKDKIKKVDFIVNTLIDRICRILVYEFKLKKERLNIGSWAITDFENFIDDVPSARVLHELTKRRDNLNQMQRPITSNDYWDIIALMMAIPYCDLVVTDKMFVSLIRNAKLDIKYHCRVITLTEFFTLDINEFANK